MTAVVDTDVVYAVVNTVVKTVVNDCCGWLFILSLLANPLIDTDSKNHMKTTVS